VGVSAIIVGFLIALLAASSAYSSPERIEFTALALTFGIGALLALLYTKYGPAISS
jgi:membrane protease YdiL (CAAX protease family)